MDQIRAIHSETAERYYNCRYCGARGEVAFRARGDSGWQAESLLLDVEREDVHQAAEEDLMRDAERVLHLIKCPTCKRRDAGYVRWAYIRVLAWFALGGVVYSVLGVIAQYRLYALGFGVIGCVQAWREYSRFRRADRATILRLKPGTRPAEKPVSPPRPVPLPPARAIAAPPVAPVAQRGPDDEPAFLGKTD